MVRICIRTIPIVTIFALVIVLSITVRFGLIDILAVFVYGVVHGHISYVVS